MKRNFKKNLVNGVAGAAVMAFLIAGMGITAKADEYTADGTHTMTVTADVASSYTVQLPATLELTRSSNNALNYKGSFTAGAKGILPTGNIVSIETDGNNTSHSTTGDGTDTFTMTGTDGNTAEGSYSFVYVKNMGVQANFGYEPEDTSTFFKSGEFIVMKDAVAYRYRKVIGSTDFATYKGTVNVTFPAADNYTGIAKFKFGVKSV